jgi:hypothetical protein
MRDYLSGALGRAPDIRGIRKEQLDPAELELAEAIISGQAQLRNAGLDSSTLVPSSVAGAAFVDGEGHHLDVMRLSAGATQGDVPALALGIAARLTNPLANGADLYLVVDLSDITINKALLETALRDELAALGVPQAAIDRLAILRTRS